VTPAIDADELVVESDTRAQSEARSQAQAPKLPNTAAVPNPQGKAAQPKGGAGKYVLMGVAVLAVVAIAAAFLRVH
jgi:hypothetical protein